MIYEDYKNLHQIPELGFKEFKTSTYILQKLKYTKAIVSKINTGICAFFNFKKKKTIAFRSELDALKIIEKNKILFKSKHVGFMHACGHDAHMAVLLSLIDYVNQINNYSFNILFIFQPSEESFGGSLSMIPHLSNYNIEVIIGTHFFPSLKENKIYTSNNTIFASSSEIDVKIYGKSIHIANYRKKDDVIYIGHRLITNLKKKAKKDNLLLHFCSFHSGNTRNVTPSFCNIKGSLRGLDESICNSFINNNLGSTNNVKFKISQMIPPLKNNYIYQEKIINDLNINTLSNPFFQAEDFSFYGNYFPTMFFLIGVNSSPLHTSTYLLDEKNLLVNKIFYINLLKWFSK